MKIEYMLWYQPGNKLLRCGGDDGCGGLLAEGDMEQHTKWHERVTKPAHSWKPNRAPEMIETKKPKPQRSW